MTYQDPDARSTDYRIRAQFLVAEAMRTNQLRRSDRPELGRVEYHAGADEALQALLADGWTPPAGDATDAEARLRAALVTAEQARDEANAHAGRSVRDAEAERIERNAVVMGVLAIAHRLETRPDETPSAQKVAKAVRSVLNRGHAARGRSLKETGKAT